MKPSRNKIIIFLGLYLDQNNKIVCRGRIGNGDLAEYTCHPILLPKYHHFTKLLVEEAHRNFLRGGVADTLACIRRQYWIGEGCKALSHILSNMYKI